MLKDFLGAEGPWQVLLRQLRLEVVVVRAAGRAARRTMTVQRLTRRIPLSRGLFAVIDADDYEAVSQFKWSAKKDSKRPDSWYAWRCIPEQPGPHGGRRTYQQLHTFLTGWPRVDHKDGD